MHVNNADALKSWLTVVLEPLCDADPSALARYVLALLKKDKPIRELTQCMTEQLDVFLGAETKPFLDKLFVVIKTEEYLKLQPDNEPENANIALVTDAANSIKTIRECTPPLEIKAKENADKSFESDISVPVQIANNNVVPVGAAIISPMSTNQDISPIKFTSDLPSSKETKDVRRHRTSLRSRSRSRSRSFERARKSRSRDRRLNEREKIGRQYRNKSPPTARRYDRRGDRSPKSYGRNRNRSHSDSRSRSGSPRKNSRSISPSNMENEIRGPVTTGGQIGKRQRCRDFDEKGYCMRGETCPWDHGVDPVVLEDINNPALISIQSSATPHIRGTGVHGGEYSPDAPDLWNRGANFMGPRGATTGPHRSGLASGAYPRIPGAGFRAGAGFAFSLNPAATPLQRELISVPVVDANSGGDVSAQTKRRFEPEDTVAIAEGPAKRKMPLGNRLGPRIGGGSGIVGGNSGISGLQPNCSLEIRKIPRGLNSIAHLNNHFSKFGKIVNIQISYEGDPEAAIVTFSAHAEANVAYRSTEAVLNNRFIKVFWHSNTNADHQNIIKEDQHPQRKPFPNQYQVNNVPATPIPASDPSQSSVNTIASSSLSSSTFNNSITTSNATTPHSTSAVPGATAGVAVQPNPAQLRMQNSNRINRTTEIIRKKQEEQVKAAVQLAHGLHKRKHDLLQQYLKQMRSALDLIDRVESSDPQRAKLLSTVKELQESIEKLRKEISSEQAQIAAQTQNMPPARKSKEQQQKELLDVELELITQQQEGNDTTAIQKRLQELQRSFGTGTRPYFPTRPVRVRPAPPGSTSVDRRTTTLVVAGFKVEDSDALLGHFKHFGEITKNQLDKNVPSLAISFTTRSYAEQAILRGRIFKEKPLQINWLNPIANAQQKAEVNSAETVLENNDDAESDDAESEDRSWRR